MTVAGKRHVATVLEWMNYSWTYGGDLFDESGKPGDQLPGQRGRARLREGDHRRSLRRAYTSATWDETTADLQQGLAAQAITWGDTAGAMEDKSASKVVGKMGYADIPVKERG